MSNFTINETEEQQQLEFNTPQERERGTRFENIPVEKMVKVQPKKSYGYCHEWKPEPQDYLIGEYRGHKMVPVQNGTKESKAYIIDTDRIDGTYDSVWETTILNDLFDSIEIGAIIKLTYLGEKLSKNGYKYKMFDLLELPSNQ